MRNLINFLLYLGLLLFTAEVQAQSTAPNILFVYVDDLGYHDLSCTGSEIYQTPNIDRLAAQGVQFEQAYSSYPRCTPSRYGLMTGTYPVNEDHGHLVGIPQEQNFIHHFNEAGYHTQFVGKWHLGDEDNSPMNFGFDISYAAGHAGGVGQRFYPFNTKPNGKRHKEIVPDVEQDCKEGDYLPDVLTDKTMELIQARPAGAPFFVMLAFYAVHTPLEAKEEDKKRNAAEIAAHDYGDVPEYIEEGTGRRKMRQDDPDYAGMVENVDENVGRLLQFLEDNGLTENTIVVFSSDHGGLSNDGFKGERNLATTNMPLRAGKGWLYEGGIRVPLLFRWPVGIKPRKESSSIVLGMDVIPTLLDLAINQEVEGIDAKSFKPVLVGKEDWSERTVFWHSRKARPHSTGDPKTSAIRAGDYKLLQFFEEDRVELYNLVNDPGEEHDLATEEPLKTAELLATLLSWKKEYLVPERLQRKQKPDRD
ncbi:sulfatase [Lewinella sp. LCG006]|uniref:sulfatase n=1 Tax=Lewinella sp. LCG006 TaxID=3231911 RepID=UPI0034610FCB